MRKRRATLVLAVAACTVLFAAPVVEAAVYGGSGRDSGSRGGTVVTEPGTPPKPLPPNLEQKPVQGAPKDVPPDHWAAAAINQMRSLGIMVGDPDNSFRPDAQVTNAETVMVFLRLLGQNPKVGTGKQNWYDPAMEQARSLGWITEDQARQADRGMDRLAVAVMLARALKLQPATGTPPWSDVSGVPQEALGYLIALHRKGLFKGYPDGTFRPGRVVTRAEVAILVSRILSGIR